MTAICQFSIPGDPVAWARTRRSKAGFNFTPTKQRNYGEVMRFAAAEAMRGDEPFEGAAKLIVQVYKPIPRSWAKTKQADAALGKLRPTSKPDWDNYGKLASDAMNGIVYRDDAQIVSSTVEKYYGILPRVDVLVMGAGA